MYNGLQLKKREHILNSWFDIFSFLALRYSLNLDRLSILRQTIQSPCIFNYRRFEIRHLNALIFYPLSFTFLFQHNEAYLINPFIRFSSFCTCKRKPFI